MAVKLPNDLTDEIQLRLLLKQILSKLNIKKLTQDISDPPTKVEIENIQKTLNLILD